MSPIYSPPLPLAIGSSACPLTSLAILSNLACLLWKELKYLKFAHAMKRRLIHTVRTRFFMQCWLLESLTFVKEDTNKTKQESGYFSYLFQVYIFLVIFFSL